MADYWYRPVPGWACSVKPVRSPVNVVTGLRGRLRGPSASGNLDSDNLTTGPGRWRTSPRRRRPSGSRTAANLTTCSNLTSDTRRQRPSGSPAAAKRQHLWWRYRGDHHRLCRAYQLNCWTHCSVHGPPRLTTTTGKTRASHTSVKIRTAAKYSNPSPQADLGGTSTDRLNCAYPNRLHCREFVSRRSGVRFPQLHSPGQRCVTEPTMVQALVRDIAHPIKTFQSV